MKVVSCIYEFKRRILLLKRVKDGAFGIVGGKKEETIDKDDLDVIVRECSQEIGISTQKEKYKKINEWFGNPVYQYRLADSEIPKITLNSAEHDKYIFLFPNEALNLNLSNGLHTIIKKYSEAN